MALLVGFRGVTKRFSPLGPVELGELVAAVLGAGSSCRVSRKNVMGVLLCVLQMRSVLETFILALEETRTLQFLDFWASRTLVTSVYLCLVSLQLSSCTRPMNPLGDPCSVSSLSHPNGRKPGLPSQHPLLSLTALKPGIGIIGFTAL